MKPLTPQQAKDQIAKKYCYYNHAPYQHWDDLMNDCTEEKRWIQLERATDEAMLLFAQSKAEEFADWICKNGYNTVNISVEPAWSKGFPEQRFTTSQLYKQFQDEQLNQKK